MFTGIECLVAGLRGRVTGREHFDDHTVFHHQPASGIEIVGGKHGKGIFSTRYGSRALAGSSEKWVQVASSVLPCLLIQGRRGFNEPRGEAAECSGELTLRSSIGIHLWSAAGCDVLTGINLWETPQLTTAANTTGRSTWIPLTQRIRPASDACDSTHHQGIVSPL